MFFAQVERNSLRPAIYYRTDTKKQGESFKSLNWDEYGQIVSEVAAGLLKQGISKKDKVGILSNTRFEWCVADVSIMVAGAVTVSLYHTCTPEELVYLINDCGLTCLFIEDKKQFEKISKIAKEVPSLKTIISFESIDQSETFGELKQITFEELKKGGREKLEMQAGLLSKIQEAILPEDTATIVYTSGTSGQLKGVILTHHNILCQIQAIPSAVPISQPHKHALLAFLTSAHIFQRIAGHWYFIGQACPIYFCNRLERVGQYLKESQATIILAVPLLLEKIKNKTLQQIEELPASQKNAVKAALSAAIKAKEVELKAKSFAFRTAARATHRVLYDSVLKHIKEKISPTLMAVISGGAPLATETILFFHAIGIYLIEGYGLTETTGIMAANSLKQIKLGSVGKPLDGLLIRTASDGEILAKGEVVFKKYLNKPEATQEAFTVDGWFKTGDLGHIDHDGFLFITGRKKDLIVTAGGKKVSPALIEESLRGSEYIDQIAVFGDKQKWLTALITLNKETTLKALYGQEAESQAAAWKEITERPEAERLIAEELKKRLSHLAEYERINKFKILPEAFSQAKDEITHTMKLKRSIIEKNYAEVIQEMYTST